MSKILEQEFDYVKEEYDYLANINKDLKELILKRFERHIPDGFSEYNDVVVNFSNSNISREPWSLDIEVHNKQETGVFWSRSPILRSQVDFYINNDKHIEFELFRKISDGIDDGLSNKEIVDSLKDQVKAKMKEISYGSGGHNLGETEVTVNGEKKTVFITPKDVAETMSSAFKLTSNFSNEEIYEEIKLDFLNHAVNDVRLRILQSEMKKSRTQIHDKFKDELRLKAKEYSQRLNDSSYSEIIRDFEYRDFHKKEISILSFSESRQRIDIESEDRFERDLIDIQVSVNNFEIYTTETDSGRKNFYVRDLNYKGSGVQEKRISKREAFDLIRQSEDDSSKILMAFKRLKESESLAESREKEVQRYGGFNRVSRGYSLLEIFEKIGKRAEIDRIISEGKNPESARNKRKPSGRKM